MGAAAKLSGDGLCEPAGKRPAVQKVDGVQRSDDADDVARQGARSAVCAFLAGFGLDPERHAAIVERILAGVCADRGSCPHASLGACASAQAEQQFEIWLKQVLGTEVGDSALPIGRAAFLACDGPVAWADVVLLEDGLPDAFVAAMRAAAPILSPVPTPGGMAAQSLESWSVTDAVHGLVEALGGNLGWGTGAKLITTSIKPGKPIR